MAMGHFIAVQGTEKGEGTGASLAVPSPQRHFRVWAEISIDPIPPGPVLPWSSCCQTPCPEHPSGPAGLTGSCCDTRCLWQPLGTSAAPALPAWAAGRRLSSGRSRCLGRGAGPGGRACTDSPSAPGGGW